jgi:hypothetical protein
MPVPTCRTVLLIGCNAALIVDQRAFRGASSPFIAHDAAHPGQRRSAQIGRVTEALRTAADVPRLSGVLGRLSVRLGPGRWM